MSNKKCGKQGKERIATKIARINKPDAPVQNYPHCTEVWQKDPEDVRQRVHDDCNDDHGLVENGLKESLGTIKFYKGIMCSFS